MNIEYPSRPVLRTEDGEMAAYCAQPRGAARAGVLLFQEAWGVTAHIRGLADRLAEEGYAVVAPELFHRSAPAGYEGDQSDIASAMPHIAKLTPAGLEVDIRAAHAFLAAAPATAGKPLAALGFCLGGRVAYLAATAVPLAAAVSYYGGASEVLRERAGRVGCPLLLIWGGLDRHIPATDRRVLADALTRAGKDFISVVFSQAEHAFNNDQRAAYHPMAARQAWALRQAFFDAHLPPGA